MRDETRAFAQSDPGGDVEQLMETPEEIETYTQPCFGPRLAVGMITGWWDKLTRGQKC